MLRRLAFICQLTSTSRPLFLKLLMRWFSKPAFSAMAVWGLAVTPAFGISSVKDEARQLLRRCWLRREGGVRNRSQSEGRSYCIPPVWAALVSTAFLDAVTINSPAIYCARRRLSDVKQLRNRYVNSEANEKHSASWSTISRHDSGPEWCRQTQNFNESTIFGFIQ